MGQPASVAVWTAVSPHDAVEERGRPCEDDDAGQRFQRRHETEVPRWYFTHAERGVGDGGVVEEVHEFIADRVAERTEVEPD